MQLSGLTDALFASDSVMFTLSFLYRTDYLDPITISFSVHKYGKISDPGVNIHDKSCPLVVRSPRTHNNIAPEQL